MQEAVHPSQPKVIEMIDSSSAPIVTAPAATTASAPTAAWILVVYRVSSRDRQERILRAIREIDRPGVVAVGSVADDGPYVVVDNITVAGDRFARRVVRRIDPSASCVHATSMPATA